MSNVVGKRTIVIALGAILALTATVSLLGFSLSRMASATAGCVNSLAASKFEIDPNANLVVDNPAVCIDWLAATVNTNTDAKADLASGQNDDSFGQGTAEDNPNPTIVNGSIPPEKSDLKAFGLYEEDDATTGDPIAVNLFWTRVQEPNGTTNMDFELNQLECDGTADTCANNGTRKQRNSSPRSVPVTARTLSGPTTYSSATTFQRAAPIRRSRYATGTEQSGALGT